MGLLDAGAVRLAFHLAEHQESVARLMARYANVPMSLADACLVRMSELNEGSAVVTFDADFAVYRKHGRHVVPTKAGFTHTTITELRTRPRLTCAMVR